jgi:hypothetical protein
MRHTGTHELVLLIDRVQLNQSCSHRRNKVAVAQRPHVTHMLKDEGVDWSGHQCGGRAGQSNGWRRYIIGNAGTDDGIVFGFVTRLGVNDDQTVVFGLLIVSTDDAILTPHSRPTQCQGFFPSGDAL